MFYSPEDKNGSFLRFGDVIAGFFHLTPSFNDLPHNSKDYSVKFEKKDYFVVLTPCCSIKDSKITLVPLKKVDIRIFSNSYLVEDLLRVNKPIPPEKSVSPEVWKKKCRKRKK